MALSKRDISTLDPADDRTITSPDGIALTLNATGDINGDGFLDYIFAAPDETNATRPASDFYTTNIQLPSGATGSTYVVLGTEEGLPGTVDLSSLDGTNGFAIKNDAIASGTNNSSSMASATVGDFNNDGFDDILTSFEGASTRPGRDGALIFGSEDGFTAEIKLSTLTDAQGHLISHHGGDAFSVGKTLFMDIDGDGFSDIVSKDEYSDPKGISIIFGTDTDLTGTLLTDGSSSSYDLGVFNPITPDGLKIELSSTLQNVGDINNDGTDDILISTVPFSGLTRVC